ncbi:hypothetical protein MRX96_059338 [Rhipicephalus microplus]
MRRALVVLFRTARFLPCRLRQGEKSPRRPSGSHFPRTRQAAARRDACGEGSNKRCDSGALCRRRRTRQGRYVPVAMSQPARGTGGKRRFSTSRRRWLPRL